MYILDEMNESQQPLFQIRMELQNAQIKFIPDLNTERENNFSNYINNMIMYIENMIDIVPHVVHTESTCKVSFYIC